MPRIDNEINETPSAIDHLEEVVEVHRIEIDRLEVLDLRQRTEIDRLKRLLGKVRQMSGGGMADHARVDAIHDVVIDFDAP